MKYDVVIVGGGMVGASLAYALAQHTTHSIALIDATPPALTDPRLIALNYASSCLLKNLKLFEALKPYASSINTVHVSHQGRFGATRIRASEMNLEALGYMVPAKHINTVLSESLRATRVVEIRPGKVTGLVKHPDSVDLTVETPKGCEIIHGKIIIAADGTDSTLRALLAIPTEKKTYPEKAIVTKVQLMRSHEGAAYERFVQQGVIALLPLPENDCALIWMGPAAKMASLMAQNEADFLASLQSEFGHRLGLFKSVEQRFSFSLQRVIAKKRLDHRVLFIGNAAHTLHPLGAQGLNMAFYEIAALIDLLKDADLNKVSLSQWETYPLAQQFTLGLSDFLNNLFSIDFFPVNMARQVGMIGMDVFGIIKRRFTNMALGRQGRVPRLLMDEVVF